MIRNRGIALNDRPWWLSGGIPPANCVAAYRAVGATDLASSYTNLANPGLYDLTLGTAPAWGVDTGWVFNGTTNSRYLKTGIIPKLDQSWSAIVRVKLSSVAQKAVYFSRSGTNKDFGLYMDGGTYWRAYNVVNVALLYGGNPVDVEVIFGMTGRQAYYNDIANPNLIGAGSTTATQGIYLGAANLSGSPDLYMIGNIYCVAFYDTVLTHHQIVSLGIEMKKL